MTKVSKNSLELIENTFKNLKGKVGKAFLATLLLVAPVMLCVFSVYLIPLAVLLFGVVQTGYIRYMRDLLNDKQPSLKLVFGEFTNPGLEILLGTMLISMFVVGGVVLIVPGIILVALYSMSFYFAENKKSITPMDAMKQARVHMKGNHTNMFSYKVWYWLLYVLLIILGLVGVMVALNLWAEYKALTILIYAVDFIFITLAWTMVSVFYNASNELFFRELLVYSGEDKEKTVEVKAEPVKEIVEEVAEKPVKKSTKAPVKKTTATTTKKTTTTKATGTKATAKPATKTTAAKKTAGTKTTTAKAATTKPATTKTTSAKTTATKKPAATKKSTNK